MAQAGNGSTSEEAVGAPALERVTVNLTARSSRLLRELMGSLGLSKTDTINRAVQLYADLQKVMDADGAIYVREAGGELERLRIY